MSGDAEGSVTTELDLDVVRTAIERPPLFVVGCPRSGTTLVQLMLDSHPSLAIPPETVFVVPVAGHPRASEWTASEAAERVIAHMGFPRLGLSPDLVRRSLGPLGVKDAAGVVRAVLAMYAAAQGKGRWGEKTPIQVYYQPLLSRLFPDAQFLHVIRDGRETASSLAEMWWGPHSLLGAGYIWRTAVAAGRRDGRRLGISRYHEVRLEDLVAAPEEELDAICRFIGESFEPRMLRYHETASARVFDEHRGWHENVSKPPTAGLRDWRAGHGPSETRALEVYLQRRLSEFGYEASTFSRGIEVAARLEASALVAKASYRLIGVAHARTGRYLPALADLGQIAGKVGGATR